MRERERDIGGMRGGRLLIEIKTKGKSSFSSCLCEYLLMMLPGKILLPGICVVGYCFDALQQIAEAHPLFVMTVQGKIFCQRARNIFQLCILTAIVGHSNDHAIGLVREPPEQHMPSGQ